MVMDIRSGTRPCRSKLQWKYIAAFTTMPFSQLIVKTIVPMSTKHYLYQSKPAQRHGLQPTGLIAFLTHGLTHGLMHGLAAYAYHTSCIKCNPRTLCNELDNTSSLLDLLLGELGNESGLDDEWSVETAFTELVKC